MQESLKNYSLNFSIVLLLNLKSKTLWPQHLIHSTYSFDFFFALSFHSFFIAYVFSTWCNNIYNIFYICLYIINSTCPCDVFEMLNVASKKRFLKYIAKAFSSDRSKRKLNLVFWISSRLVFAHCCPFSKFFLCSSYSRINSLLQNNHAFSLIFWIPQWCETEAKIEIRWISKGIKNNRNRTSMKIALKQDTVSIYNYISNYIDK